MPDTVLVSALQLKPFSIISTKAPKKGGELSWPLSLSSAFFFFSPAGELFGIFETESALRYPLEWV